MEDTNSERQRQAELPDETPQQSPEDLYPQSTLPAVQQIQSVQPQSTLSDISTGQDPLSLASATDDPEPIEPPPSQLPPQPIVQQQPVSMPQPLVQPLVQPQVKSLPSDIELPQLQPPEGQTAEVIPRGSQLRMGMSGKADFLRATRPVSASLEMEQGTTEITKNNCKDAKYNPFYLDPTTFREKCRELGFPTPLSRQIKGALEASEAPVAPARPDNPFDGYGDFDQAKQRPPQAYDLKEDYFEPTQPTVPAAKPTPILPSSESVPQYLDHQNELQRTLEERQELATVPDVVETPKELQSVTSPMYHFSPGALGSIAEQRKIKKEIEASKKKLEKELNIKDPNALQEKQLEDLDALLREREKVEQERELTLQRRDEVETEPNEAKRQELLAIIDRKLSELQSRDELLNKQEEIIKQRLKDEEIVKIKKLELLSKLRKKVKEDQLQALQYIDESIPLDLKTSKEIDNNLKEIKLFSNSADSVFSQHLEEIKRNNQSGSTIKDKLNVSNFDLTQFSLVD